MYRCQLNKVGNVAVKSLHMAQNIKVINKNTSNQDRTGVNLVSASYVIFNLNFVGVPIELAQREEN